MRNVLTSGVLRCTSGWLTSACCHLVALIALAAWSLTVGQREVGIAQLDATIGKVEIPELETIEIAAETVEHDDAFVMLAPPEAEVQVDPASFKVSETREENAVEQMLRLSAGRRAAHGSSSGGSSGEVYGTSASFFGTIAPGERFVYILDASNSMSAGKRWPRAIQELVGSVERLANDQEFHVVLFCGSTRAMFDASIDQASLIAAAQENKQRLKLWLSAARLGPWTDPRPALDLALSLQPSAVFLLSDGEFVDTGMDRIGGDTIRDLRQANAAQIPIHTFALEDPTGARTLRAIAEESGGTYRFIAAPPKPRVKRPRGRLGFPGYFRPSPAPAPRPAFVPP